MGAFKRALGAVLVSGIVSTVILFYPSTTLSVSRSQLDSVENTAGCEPSLWHSVSGPYFENVTISSNGAQLPAKEVLDWTSCYDEFQCARLSVSPSLIY